MPKCQLQMGTGRLGCAVHLGPPLRTSSLLCIVLPSHKVPFQSTLMEDGGSFELVLKQSWERSVSDFIFAALVQERR